MESVTLSEAKKARPRVTLMFQCFVTPRGSLYFCNFASIPAQCKGSSRTGRSMRSDRGTFTSTSTSLRHPRCNQNASVPRYPNDTPSFEMSINEAQSSLRTCGLFPPAPLAFLSSSFRYFFMTTLFFLHNVATYPHIHPTTCSEKRKRKRLQHPSAPHKGSLRPLRTSERKLKSRLRNEGHRRIGCNCARTGYAAITRANDFTY